MIVCENTPLALEVRYVEEDVIPSIIVNITQMISDKLALKCFVTYFII